MILIIKTILLDWWVVMVKAKYIEKKKSIKCIYIDLDELIIQEYV